MVKYRLIETYPGSLPLGTISKIDYSRYPKNWEAFVEQDSIVLSFKYKSEEIVTLREKGTYIIDSAEDSEFPGFTLEEQKSDPFCDIYSIKRLSDGKIFTVGDKICKASKNNVFTIASFNISSRGDTYASCTGESYSPSIAIKDFIIATPLFTTEDGLDIISKRKSYYIVSKDFKITYCTEFSEKDLEYKTFSTQKAAREYVTMNKPEFSRNQIIEMLGKLQR
jgi:hypothetical protein